MINHNNISASMTFLLRPFESDGSKLDLRQMEREIANQSGSNLYQLKIVKIEKVEINGQGDCDAIFRMIWSINICIFQRGAM